MKTRIAAGHTWRGRSGILPLLAAAVALLVVALGGSCSRSGANNATPNNDAQSSAAAPRRDLSQDESRGGHTLKRHVGRADAELQERLQHEQTIGAASTYTDRATAEEAVAAAIVATQDRISRWTERSGRHPNLVLEYNAPQPVGRTLRRGDSQAEPCSHVLAVLKFDGHGEYHVLTSYPECR
jgi:hypothetical protein